MSLPTILSLYRPASLGLVCALACAVVLPTPAWANFKQLGMKTPAMGGAGQPNLGFSIALSAAGDTAVVGGLGDANGVGAVWVFTRTTTGWTQQGAKLVGTGGVGAVQSQGYVAAISGDGGTILVGAPSDNVNAGAAWVFTRTNGVWTQQGAKLVGAGAAGMTSFGSGVALSYDGSTAAIGGYLDSGGIGASWVYTRSNGVWTQQGTKLVGTGNAGSSHQGLSVTLSGDGNTLGVGGYGDNGSVGAAWVYTRSAGAWSQHGGKLVGAGAVGASEQGQSVALSQDGTTLLVGGYNDNGNIGATWVFTRSGGGWVQQGSKLVGSGNVGPSYQGKSVSLSADGHVAIVGGWLDDSSKGAVWAFRRNGAIWSQVGNKLVGSGAVGPGAAKQGGGVAVSANGRLAISGGQNDNGGQGAFWTFADPAVTPHDFEGDGKSDLLWRESAGDLRLWSMNGASIVQNAGLGAIPPQWSIAAQRDFDGDGKADILWRHTSGALSLWLMDGPFAKQATELGSVSPVWSIAAVADFDGDSMADILWRDGSGSTVLWLMSGSSVLQNVALGVVPANWSVVRAVDLDGNGKADLVWRNAGGDVALWMMNGAQVAQVASIGAVSVSWTLIGGGDFDGDGKGDVLWRHSDGTLAMWMMNGAAIAQNAALGVMPASWSLAQTGDYNGDGKADLLWRETSGAVALWTMNGPAASAVASLPVIPANWVVQSVNAE